MSEQAARIGPLNRYPARRESYATVGLVVVAVALAAVAVYDTVKPLYVAGQGLWWLLGEGPSIVVQEQSWQALRTIKRVRRGILETGLLARQLANSGADQEASNRKLLVERMEELEKAAREYEALNPGAAAWSTWRETRERLGEYQNLLAGVAKASGEALPLQGLNARQIRALRVVEELSDAHYGQIAARQKRLHLGDKEALLWGLTFCLAVGLVIAVLPILHAWRLRIHLRAQYQKVLRAKETLQKLSAQLMEAQEEERRKISRELHDEIGQALIATRLDLTMLERKIPSELADLREFARDGKVLVDETLHKVRDLTQLLRPTLLDEEGLLPAVRWLIRGYTRRTSLHVALEAHEVTPRLSREIEIAAYRLVQECLTNTIKHSEATHVKVSILAADGDLQVAVQDNGRALPLGPVEPEQAGGGLGLVGIRERVQQLNGRVEVLSKPGQGFCVRAVFPLGEETARAAAASGGNSEIVAT
jgi:signal transduction histidine kinase